MSKKHAFLQFFSKIALFACVFCAFFIPSAFATLPAGYTELEYIESTGTQYIDTGITPTKDMKWILDNKFTGIGNVGRGGSWNGVYAASSRFDIALGEGSADGTVVYAMQFGSKTNGVVNPAPNLQRHTFVINAKDLTWSIDNTSGSFTSSFSATNKNIFLFARNDDGGVDRFSLQKTYSSKFYNNDVLVRNFIPAKRNSDGEIGMYDTVSDTFFTNQGTGDFIAGPDAIIKIATTKMVDDEFAPLDTALTNAISVVDNVVTQTIAQAAAIGELQNTKQTRPSDDNECPANMKCLLVTDETGTPHWYPIIEP